MIHLPLYIEITIFIISILLFVWSNWVLYEIYDLYKWYRKRPQLKAMANDAFISNKSNLIKFLPAFIITGFIMLFLIVNSIMNAL